MNQLPDKFRYYHTSFGKTDPSQTGTVAVEYDKDRVRVDTDDGYGPHYWAIHEAESFVSRGVWIIDETIKPEDEGSTLVFYYIGKEDALRKARQTKDGFEVMWGGPLLNTVWYTTDQVRDFVAAGNWVVVGVE